jgi:hypothetical protein
MASPQPAITLALPLTGHGHLSASSGPFRVDDLILKARVKQ